MNLNKFKYTSWILGMLFTACSAQNDFIEEIENSETTQEAKTCPLELNISIKGFDDDPETRSASGWENGDKIYLTFTVGTGLSHGDAIYNNGTWTVNYYGSLTEGALTKCTAVYFDNPDFESSSVVMLSENTGIYEDPNGTYFYNGGTLSVEANLSPKTGRIRFAGNDNDKIQLYGITHYTSFDCSIGKFTTSIGAIKTQVSSDYTPYLYGEFSDPEQPRLNIITESSGYTRLPSPSIFQKGESGYMNIPSETSHNGWQNSVIFKINGVEFNMIPVTYDNGNFLLAETETTEELYSAITNGSNKTQNPQRNISWETWNTFLSNLSLLTELEFRMPTVEEWQFAAKGGNKSQGYTYAGSNIISNVAWYADNSDKTVHPVKQLQPNELGFYDMSGNVAEWTSTHSNSLSVYNCGGDYSSPESSCTVKSKNYAFIDNTYSYCGLRIALSNI